MRLRHAITIMGCAVTIFAGSQAFGETPVQGAGEPRDVQKLELTVGKSKVLDLPVAIKRASLANPEVADTVVLSPTQIYVTGKTTGVTNVTLWNESGKMMGMYDVVIAPDVTRLKENLHKTLPDENGILVTSDHDHITLSGTASNTGNLNRALSMAEAYAPKKVVNAMQVGGVQQVMLEVRVAEMSRELIKRLGLNFTGVGNDYFGLSVLGNLTRLASLAHPAGQSATIGVEATQLIQGAFGFNAGSTSWTGFVDALKEENALKVLAKPTLMALNGQEAAFLAGGEFPIPVPQAFGLVTVQFKKFGVGLVFTPNVLNSKHISINVAPEVSELDFANALRLQGFIVPAITTRRAATTIELADGQSFAIGGLLRDNLRESVKKVPFLGEVPILGALFRSSSFQKNETELVIIVTPHLVKPLDMNAQTLPTDYFVEPNDFEYYMMGFPEKSGHGGKLGQRSPAAEVLSNRISMGSAMEGRVGHLMP
ncbi:MAG TPA: type II and III secretion system protein family protein [Nitrospira sp.]|nr:type II and III secretion system protein family protein [Nitrospira sp.]